MEYAKGHEETFTPRQLQNTHWYKTGTGGRDGWTACFKHAFAGEIDRVGLHDCVAMRCPVAHAGSKADYEKEK